MKNIFIIFWLLLLCNYNSFCQKKKPPNQLGLSIPIIWNNSEATRYLLGNPEYPVGKGISYGINVNYSVSVYKNIYGIIGIGYFKQVFGISRPFEFNSPNQLSYSTESYYYNNIQFFSGVGYRKELNKNTRMKVEVSYNWLNSFRQKYFINKEYKTWQVNKKLMSIARIVYCEIGGEKNITKKMFIGISALFPVSTNWNNDEIFYKYDYSNDTQQIARNKFTIGTNISCYYQF